MMSVTCHLTFDENMLKILDLLAGMGQTVDNYRQSMSDFDELCHDMRTFNVSLAQDVEFQRMSAMLNDLL